MKLLNIIKRYGNDHEVLKDISLELDNCGLVSILGPSGSGKSTLLNIAGMLDPDYEGAVVYSDKPVGKSESEMRKLRAERIGFVFQEYNLINSISVKENILTSLYLVGSDFAKTKYTEVMSRFGLTDLQDRLPGTLSGGEKQRVAIVRALIRGSSVILADEPTGNLDEANAEGVFEALREASRDRLVVVATHNEALACRYSDRIIKLRNRVVDTDRDLAYAVSPLLQLTERPEAGGKPSGSGLNTAWYLRFSASNFRARRRKIVSALLVTITALICSSLVLGLYSGFQGLFGEINKDILDSDKIIVRNYSDGMFRAMDNGYLERLSETGDYAKLLPWYECKINLSAVGRTIETRTTVCDRSEFLENRIHIVSGENISKENEVIIEEKTAQEVFGETDCVRHEIIVSDETGYSRICYVSGVYRANNELNSGTTIISRELSTELASGTAEADFIFTYPANLTENRTVCRFELAKDSESGAGADVGNGRLMVNSSGLNEILRLIKPGHVPVAQDDLSDGNVSEDVLDAVIGQTMIFQRLDLTVFARMEIAGVFTEEDPSGSLVFLVSSEDADMMNAPLINRADLYLKDFSTGGRQAAVERLKDAGILYELASDRIGAQVMVKMSVINIMILVVSVVILFLSFVLCNFSAKINIMDRTYDIGVLKSLGATGAVIFRIFASDTLLMGSFAGAVAGVVVCTAWLSGITDIFVIDGATVWQFRAWHLLPVVVAGTLLPLIAGIKEIMTVSKMKIMDSVKR